MVDVNGDGKWVRRLLSRQVPLWPLHRRVSLFLFPASAFALLAVLALALLALRPTDSAQAQRDSARVEITAGPMITSSPENGDAYGPKETILVALTWSKPVAVTASQDTGGPRVRLAVGERKRRAKYERSEQDGTRLIFAYQVKSKDADSDGLRIRRNPLKLSGGSIADADGNAARRKHPALPDHADHKVKNRSGDAGQEPTPDPAPEPTPKPTPEPNNEPQFAARSVAENSRSGTNIGTLVTATDGDDDTLTYTLAGTDAATFDLDPSTGQIKVKDALDYATRSSY